MIFFVFMYPSFLSGNHREAPVPLAVTTMEILPQSPGEHSGARMHRVIEQERCLWYLSRLSVYRHVLHRP